MIKRTILFLGLSLCGGFSMAQADQKLDAIKQAGAEISSLSCHFKQTKHSAVLTEDVITTGHFFYKQPAMLLMRYDKPEGDYMLLNDDRFAVAAAGKVQVSSARTARMRSLKNILLGCIAGDFEKLDAENTQCEEVGNHYVVKLELERRSKSGFRKLEVKYDKKDLTVSSLKTIDKEGGYTLYELSAKVLNQALDDNIFKLPGK